MTAYKKTGSLAGSGLFFVLSASSEAAASGTASEAAAAGTSAETTAGAATKAATTGAAETTAAGAAKAAAETVASRTTTAKRAAAGIIGMACAAKTARSAEAAAWPSGRRGRRPVPLTTIPAVGRAMPKQDGTEHVRGIGYAVVLGAVGVVPGLIDGGKDHENKDRNKQDENTVSKPEETPSEE